MEPMELHLLKKILKHDTKKTDSIVHTSHSSIDKKKLNTDIARPDNMTGFKP